MDSRIPLFGVLGLDIGDAHVIRNAGGVITEDVIRSLTICQHALGTREIVLVHHTECGLLAPTTSASPTPSSRPPAAVRRGPPAPSPTWTTTSGSRCG